MYKTVRGESKTETPELNDVNSNENSVIILNGTHKSQVTSAQVRAERIARQSPISENQNREIKICNRERSHLSRFHVYVLASPSLAPADGDSFISITALFHDRDRTVWRSDVDEVQSHSAANELLDPGCHLLNHPVLIYTRVCSSRFAARFRIAIQTVILSAAAMLRMRK